MTCRILDFIRRHRTTRFQAYPLFVVKTISKVNVRVEILMQQKPLKATSFCTTGVTLENDCPVFFMADSYVIINYHYFVSGRLDQGSRSQNVITTLPCRQTPRTTLWMMLRNCAIRRLNFTSISGPSAVRCRLSFDKSSSTFGAQTRPKAN